MDKIPLKKSSSNNTNNAMDDSMDDEDDDSDSLSDNSNYGMGADGKKMSDESKDIKSRLIFMVIIICREIKETKRWCINRLSVT